MGKYSDFFRSVEEQAAQPDTYLEFDRPAEPGDQPATTPAPSGEDQPGVLSDAWSMYGMGSNQILEGLGWLVNSDTLQEAGKSGQEYWQERLSDRQQEANQKRFVTEDFSVGDAATDWRSYLGVLSQSLPHLATSAGGASLAGRGALALGASQKAATAAGTAGAIGSESATIGALVGADIDNTIRDMSEDEKLLSPLYQDLREQYDEGEATERFSATVANPAAWKSAAVGGLIGFTFNQYLAKAVLGRIKGGMGVEATKGAALEGGTELGQEGAQGFIQQQALHEAVERPMNYADIANQSVAGLGAGTAMGAGTGAAGALSKTPDEPDVTDRVIEARTRAEQAGGDDLAATRAGAEEILKEFSKRPEPPAFDAPLGDIGPVVRQASEPDLSPGGMSDFSGLIGEARQQTQDLRSDMPQASAEPIVTTPLEAQQTSRDGAALQQTEAEQASLAPAELVADGSVVNDQDLATAVEPEASAPPSTFQTEALAQAAAETNINPTDGQKEAGNYKKGRVRIQGMEIAIENPQGSTRSGTDPNGKRWESTMAHHYGDIKGTEAADGDNLDVFIGPEEDSDQVFVIDQQDADGSFDEHKVMVGFRDEESAKQGYLANYEDGWRVGPVTRMGMDEFKAWVKGGDTTKPLASAPSEPEQATVGSSDLSLAPSDPKTQGLHGWKKPKGGQGFVYAIQKGGHEVGFLDLSVFDDGIARIMDVVSNEGANSLGPRDVRRMQRQIMEMHPGITQFAGERVSGVRRGGEHGFAGTGEEVRVNAQRSGKPKEQESKPAKKPVSRSERNAEKVKQWLGADKGDTITLSDEVGYARAGVEYKITGIDGDGAWVESSTGRTNISRADVMRAQKGGVTATKVESTSNQEPRPADPAPPQESEPESGQADKEADQPTQPIQDFGEKIEGARKDYASKLQEAKEKDVAAVPLSESWPEPDYQKLLDAGTDPQAVGMAHAARDAVPPKPRKGWKLKGWARQTEALRNFTESVIGGEFTVADLREFARKDGNETLEPNLFNMADLYAAVGHDKSLKGLRFANVHYTMYEGKTGSFDKWQIERVAKTSDFGNMPRRLVAADTKDDAIKQFRQIRDSLSDKPAQNKQTRFDIYSSRHDKNDVFIGKKIGKDVVRIKEGFESVKEAREYLSTNQDALENTLNKMKNIPDHRKANNSPRVGKDHRNGGEVTPEAFADTFGFRGVQFGNYVEQGRRQQDLNEAYDGLMDLAGILNVPARALSLNGELGLAFGARGKGGKTAPKAHYEAGQIVINLTKKSGAGSLAHEWWHALDNYFGRGTDRKPKDAFASGGRPASDVRPEMIDAFRNVRQTVNRIGMKERSRALDKVRTKAYWSTDIEMSARAFESYVIERLKDQSASNDYLANIVSEEYWKASEALGMQDSDSYPYPEAAEVPEIRAAYDHFFQTIETREGGDGNVMFFSRGSQRPRQPLPEVRVRRTVENFFRRYKGADDVNIEYHDTAETLPGYDAERDAGATIAGQYDTRTDTIHLVVSAYDSQSAVQEALQEEILVHKGLGFFHPEDRQQLYRDIQQAAEESPEVARLWEQTVQDYKDVAEAANLNEEQANRYYAEELLGSLAQEKINWLQKGWRTLRQGIKRLLVKAGWITDSIGVDELRGRIQLVAGAFERGRRAPRRDFSRDAMGESQEGAGNETDNADLPAFSRMGNRLNPAADHFTDLDADQKSALGKIAPRTPKEKARDWLTERTDRWQTKVRQGMVDRFAALKDVDEALYGRDVIEGSTASSSWVLAQMSGAASGALQSMLTAGRLKFSTRDKVITVRDDDSKGLNDVLKKLGNAAEIERFFGWIAGNRSARLMAEGRENLFEPGEVDALKRLNQGQTDAGKSRAILYQQVFKDFQQYRDDVLEIAQETGIITPEQRETWANEFYVPFYRLADSEGGFTGPKSSGGISRQEAYKKLKGGSQNLNDLLENTMMNFHHLLQAGLKNQASLQAMDNAETLGIAREVKESERDTENSTFVLRDGQKIWYEIDDPLVFKAVTALAHPGMNSSAMKIMRGFKRLFTNLTTTTPQFVVANLLRDSMQAAATSEVSKNVLGNMVRGSKVYGNQRTRAKMMASGGSFSFGHLYGENADEMRLQITGGLARADILRSPSMVPDAVRGLWRKWNEMTEFTENINRAAIYEQNVKDRGELYAAFKARDLMNFSQYGAWPAMRVLIDVVPFLNARLQGLDKIYRSGVKPGIHTAMGQGTAGEKEAAKRFWAVTGALALASMALYLHNRDDEEYNKLEEWQKDTYWFFRISDDHAIFIPKPFEVGAIATLVERLTEQAVSDKATGELFAERLGHMLMDTFSFSPVPQIAQPALDVYANYDAFTGRPIESMGMDRISPSLRSRSNTTSIAKGLSKVSENVFGPDGNMTLSPVQIDHLIQGYFGSVGSWVAGTADTIWKTANGDEAPDTFWYENQPIRRFYKNLGNEDRYTRYGTVFYEALKETNRVYADIREYQKLGDLDSAMELVEENRNKLAYRKALNKVQRQLTDINSAMERVQRMPESSEYKRRELDRLRAIKNRIQEQVGKRLEQIKIAS